MRIITALAVASLTTTFAGAQTPPAFEVVSIRPSAPLEKGQLTSSGFRIAGPNLIGSRVTVLDLVGYGYSMPPARIGSVPSWAASDKFDVLAKLPSDSPFAETQIRAMVKELLSQRFQLKLHAEAKETSVYQLIAASSGFKLRRVTDPADPTVPPSRRVARGDGVQEWAEGKQTMRSLIGLIAGFVDRPIVNMTAIPDTETVAFAIKFVPDNLLTAPNAPVGTSVYKALEDQLGLKLEAVKMPLEYLTLERVEKPSEN